MSADERISRPRIWPDMIGLWLVALLVRILTALPMQVPGYMDAYYYYVGAARIVQGYGLSEPYIWNYLSEPLRLPMPAFQYWLPLTSFLIVPFFALFGVSFRVSQMPFILLSSCLPAIAYWVSYRLAPLRRRALIAGLLMTFTPFYLKFWVTTDSFAPFALTASLAILAMCQTLESPFGNSQHLAQPVILIEAKNPSSTKERPFASLRVTHLRASPWGWFALAGALIGLSSLARADAPLLFVAFAIAALWPGQSRTSPRAGQRALGLVVTGLACLLVLAPWLWHTWHTTGTPFNSAGARSIFLRSYDDLFSYGRPLSWRTYLEWGWPAILRSKLDAAGSNLLTLGGVFLTFFLAPFAAIEFWARRRELLVQLVFWYMLLLYLVMTLIFTFPGPRGSLLHSGSALLPFLLPLAVHGLDRAIAWVARRRPRWDVAQASRVFGAGVVALSMLFSAFLYVRAIWAGGDASQAWNTHDDLYRVVGAWLDEHNEPADAPVMVVNPPAFYYHTGRPALAIPNEPPDVVMEVCRRFGVNYLLLERDRPHPLDRLWAQEDSHPALTLVHAWHEAHMEGKLYRCQP